MTPESLKTIIERLENLEDKRLACGYLWDRITNCGCLMGALLPAELREDAGCTLVVGSNNPRTRFINKEVREWAEGLGLIAEDVDYLQRLNDGFKFITAEERYVKVLEALKEELRDA